MAAEVGRRALVQYNVHSRVVHFTGGKLPDVVAEIRRVFSDVLPPAAASPHLVVQMKQEEWGGEFVDVSENESLPDKSILRVRSGIYTDTYARYPCPLFYSPAGYIHAATREPGIARGEEQAT